MAELLRSIKNGATSVIARVILNSSASDVGAGDLGLTSASAGLIISTIADNEASALVYTQAAGNIETISVLGTYAAPTTNKCRFKEVDQTNHPGSYEIQLANARYAVAGAESLLITISGPAALNLQKADFVRPLVADDPQVAKPTNFNLLSIDAAGRCGPFPTGTVVTDGGNSATQIKTDRTEATNDFWKDALLLITSGVLIGQVKKITAYTGATKILTFGAFTGTPADGVTFVLVNF